jgi:hypothetical protein
MDEPAGEDGRLVVHVPRGVQLDDVHTGELPSCADDEIEDLPREKPAGNRMNTRRARRIEAVEIDW